MRRFAPLLLPCRIAAACCVVVSALPAAAQTPAQAQWQYERQIAACDPSQPRPQYNACIRAAGYALDRMGPAASSGAYTSESADGRATILQPAGAAPNALPPSTAVPETATSSDGRATILVPSDSTLRGGFTR